MSHHRTCPAYGNYQPPYEECTCGDEHRHGDRKIEAELKSNLFERFHTRHPGFVVQQMASAGSPDRSITGCGVTTHWEFKHGTPDFDTSGLQVLTCLRLAQVGHCRYVIWQQHGTQRRTMIVHPKVIKARKGWQVEPEYMFAGFDLDWLIDKIVETHLLLIRNA